MDSDKSRTDSMDEVTQWVRRLIDGAGAERRRAASKVASLGISLRGSIRSRGSLVGSAAQRLPDSHALREMASCLNDADKSVRSQVALALGEWGGEDAAVALKRLLEMETDADVQLYCVTALKTIGGPVAVAALGDIAASGERAETIRSAAIRAIEELASGKVREDTERSGPAGSLHSGNRLRVRRNVGSTRRLAHSERPSDIVRALRGVALDGGALDLLKSRAHEALEYLHTAADDAE